MNTIRVKSANLLRRDSAENWTKKNPVLRQGEEGYETDTGRRKVGDGTGAWSELSYTVDQTYTPDSSNAQSGFAVAEALETDKSRFDNTFAGALKGTASGSELLLTDISPIVHGMKVRVSSDSISDLTAVRLIKKNGSGEIISEYTPNADGTVEGVTSFVGNEDIWDGTVAEEFAGGDGSENTPYLIENASQLAKAVKSGSESSGKYYKLTKDIVINSDLNNKPINWYGAADSELYNLAFRGTFDGGGYTISGLYYNGSNYAGLFPLAYETARFKNLCIKNSGITTKGNAGVIVGHLYAQNDIGYKSDGYSDKYPSFVECCIAEDVSVNAQYAGGVVGVANGEGKVYISFYNCFIGANLTGKTNVGADIAHGWKNGGNDFYSFPQNVITTAPFNKNFIKDGLYRGTNVYTTAEQANLPSMFTRLTAEQAKGENAKINMTGLDWDNVWRIEEDELPKLRNFSYGAIQLVTDKDGVEIFCEYNKDTNLSLQKVTSIVKSSLKDKENISNKTASLTSNSTNEEYPTAKAVYDFAHKTFVTADDLNILKSIVDGKKVIYHQYAKNEKLIVEKSKVYILKAYPSDTATINLWVTDSSDSETQAYAEGDSLFPNCTTGILISPANAVNYSGVLFFGITGKLSITNLSPFYGRRFASWRYSDIKNLFLKSTANDGMAVWTIAL